MLYCLEMDKFNGVCELNKPLQLQRPGKESVWFYILIYSLILSKHLLQTASLMDASDRRMNSLDTQKASSLVDKFLDRGLIGPLVAGV